MKKPNNRTTSTFRAFSRISAGISIAVGCAVVVGWLLNITVLKSIHTDWIAMKVNTAICFVLLGISLFLQSIQASKYPRLHKTVGRVLASIATLIGLLTLVEYIFGWNLCIDQLLYKEQTSDAFPGRMAPNTALSFLLLGLSLIFLNLNVKGRYPSQFFSLVTAMIASLALLEYIYDASFLHGMSHYIGMAINTAVVFVIISYGSLCARSDHGLMIPLASDSPGGFVLRRLVPPVVGISVVSGWLVLTGEKAGFYDIALGTAILVIVIVLAFTILIWQTSLSLHRMDAERKRVEEALQDSIEQRLKDEQEQTEELRMQGEELAAANEELAATNEELIQNNRVIAEANYTLTFVNDLAADFLSGTSLDHSLKTMLQTAKKLAEADAACVAIFEHPDIVKAWVYDTGGDACGVETQAVLGNHMPHMAAKYSQGVVIDNNVTNANYPSGHIPLRNLMSLAVEVKDGWALLALANKEDGFSESDAGKLKSLAHLASIIIDRAKLDESEREARAEAETRAAELESFVSNIADGVCLFAADGDLLFMNEAGKAIFELPHGLQLPDWRKACVWLTLDGAPMPIENLATARALRGETAKDVRSRVKFPWGKEAALSVSASPIKDSEGRIIGATNVFRDISDFVAIEQQKQELYEREHHIAETLQKALIPQQGCYHISGCDVVLKYDPALKEAEVGGDFYDAFEVEKGKIGILIGDVAGKGLMAAMRVAAARHAIRSYAYLDPEPSKVLSLANDALYKERTDEAHMLTAFFAVVDVNKGTITYASGGHESPMLVRSDGRLEQLDETGLALGIMSGFPYTQSTRKLEYGDKVVMFTDGITEARIGDNLFDGEGVRNCLTENGCMPMDEIAYALLNAAKNHAGGELHDDSAIVVFGLSAQKADITDELVLEIWNKDEDLAVCRQVVEQAAMKIGFTGEGLWDIVSAVFEAAANAVTHGAKQSDKPIILTVRTGNRFFQAIIQDSGEGFTCPETNLIPSPVSPRGRGIPLMKAFMDEVKFENDNGCKVILTKYLRDKSLLKSDRVNTNGSKDQLSTKIDTPSVHPE